MTGRRNQTSLTVTQLQQGLEHLRDRALPADLLENNRSEELSILMQMLGQKHRRQAAMKMEKGLRACLTPPLKDR